MKRSILFLSFAAAASLPLALRAADGSWAIDSSGLWGTPGNWNSGVIATGTDATAYFTNAITAPRVVTNDLAGQSIGHLTFSGGANAWSLPGASLSLSQGSGASLLSVLSGNASISAVLAGGPNVVKAGAGTLGLSGANTYAGTSIISNGTLVLGGGAAILGFGTGLNWRVNSTSVGTAPFAADRLTLTDNGGSQSRNVYYTQRQSVSGGFVQSITYQAGGNRTADGWGFLVHNDGRGTNAAGSSGGNLALNTITQSVALAFNIYNTDGVRLLTNGVTIGNYLATAPVALDSGNPVSVTVVHDPVAQTLAVLFAEQGTTNTKAFVFTNVNVPAQTKTNAAYVGFSGSTGGSTATHILGGEASFFNNVLPVGTDVLLPAGGVLDLGGTGQAVASLSDDGTAGGVVTNSGLAAAALGFAPTNGATAVFGGTMADGAGTNAISVVMMGHGVQVLSGANAHRGGTHVNGGTLRIGSEANLGASPSVLTLGGGTLSVTSSLTFARPVYVPMGGTFEVAAGMSVTITNNVFASNSVGLLAKSGPGDLFLSQPLTANAWTGPLVVREGLVAISGSGDRVIRGGSVTIHGGGTFRLDQNNCIVNTCTITANADGTFDMNNQPEAFAYLAGSGSVSNTGGMELDLGTVANTFGGPISGFGLINVRGVNGVTGVQIFGGTNTFSGGVRLTAGTLGISEDVNLGASTGAVTFAGGILRILGTNLLNLDGRPVNWTNFTGGLDIAASSHLFTVTNVLAGAGTLTKYGPGTLLLAASNTLSGATVVNAGTLEVGSGGGLASAVVTVNTNAQLLVDLGGTLDTNGTLNLLQSGTNYGRASLAGSVTMAVFAINGAAQTIGTWGATGSGAQFTNDSFFAGAGTLTVTAGLAATPSDSSWVVDAGGLWGTPSNWANGLIAFGTNATAHFTNAITADRAVTNGYLPLEIGSLVFAAESNNWTVTGSPATLVVTGGTPAVTVQSNAATLAVTLNGSQGLAKNGPGMLTLSATNNFTGATAVNQGVLQISGSGSLYSNGNAAGAVSVNSGGTLQFARSDSFGVHTALPQVAITVNAGGLLQNTGAVFNTLKDVTLNGGELRANGGASATFQAFQLKGTVTVSGASASAITAPSPSNIFHQIQVGDTSTGGVTVVDVADVTGDAAPDLAVSASFANGRNAANNATVPSGIQKKGAGTLLVSGSSINTGPLQMDGSRVVVRGGALNGAVVLTNSASLVAEDGPGLLGELYAQTAAAANFVNRQLLSAHLGGVQPMLGYNGPLLGTNFDFGATGAYMPPAGLTVVEGRWRGKYFAPTNGLYTFGSASDDGSMVWIDGTNVVNNNFAQGVTTRTGSIALAVGLHDIELQYYNSGGAGGYFVDVTPPPGTGPSNRLALASLTTGPMIGSLLGDASGSVILSNTVLTVSHGTNSTYGGTISGNGSFRKIGTGILTLGAANSPTNWILGGGRLGIDSDAQLGAGVPVTFDGGFLRITGTGMAGLDAHPINEATFVGGLDVADAAHTFTVTQSLGIATGSSVLWKQGAGTLTLSGGSSVLNNSFVVFNGTLQALNASLLNQSNTADQVGSVAGDSGSLVLRGSSSLSRLQNNLLVGNAAGATGFVTVADNAVLSGNAFRPVYVGNSGRGLLTVQDNGFVSNRLIVGNNSGGAGALHLRGGSVFNNDGGGQDSAFGWNTGAYGYLGLFAGAFTNRGWVWIGGNNGNGVMQQTGGQFHHLGIDGGFDIGRGGTGVVHLAGGTFTVTANNVNLNANGNHGGLCILTLTTGSTAVVAAGNVALGNRSNMVAILNLNGGSLRANQVYKQLGVASSFAVVNFDGGTLRANLNGNLFNTGANSPDQINILGGGATFDSMSGLSVTIPQNLRAPTGNGVVSIPVATPGSGYIGSPVVSISGGGGTGATAFAVVDLDTNSVTYGQLQSVRITCPGQGYSSAPAVLLQGGGPVAAATLGAASLGANTSGALTLLGSGSVALLGTNTYAGGTTISNGILLVGSTNAVGSGSITIAGDTAGIGPGFAIGQDFINWLTTRTVVTSSRALLGLGATSASNLNLTALTNWSLTAAGGAYTYSGNLTITGTNLYLGGGNGTLTYAPVIGSGTNVFIGLVGGSPSGVVTLSGANGGYTGEINVISGTLRGGAANSFGSSSTVVYVSNGTTLDVGGQNLGAVKVYVLGTGVSPNGAIVNSGATAIPGLQKVYLTGDATFGGPNRWDIRSGSLGPVLDLAGFTLRKTNASELAVFNTEVTDGNILVGQGIFRFEQGSTATTGVGRITVQPAGTLDFWSLSGAVTRPITVTGGTVTVGSGIAAVGSEFTLAGPTNTFNIASAANTLAPTGLITGAGALLKTGFGTMRLHAPAAYTGATLVNGGTLELAAGDTNNGVIGRSSAVAISNGAVVVSMSGSLFGTNTPPVLLRADGFLGTTNGAYSVLAGSVTLAGGGIGGGAPDATFGNWILATNLAATTNSSITAPRIQLAAAGGVQLDVAAASTLGSGTSFEDPAPSGAGALVKTGSGTLSLAGASTYSGPTVVSAGTVKLNNTPPPVSGMLYWLDASDPSTLTIDANGKVSQWDDKSGNALHFAQTTANMRPTYLVAGLNGRPSLRFDGVTNQLALGSATAPQTVFIVNRPTQFTALNGIWGSSNPADKGIRMTNATAWQSAGDANDFTFGAGGSVFINGVQTNGFGASGTPHILSETRGAGHTTSYNNTLLGFYFSGRVFRGDIAEVLVYSTALSDADRQQVEQYLVNKWMLGSSGTTNNVLPPATLVQMAAGSTLDLNGVSQTVGALADVGAGGGLVTNSGATAALFLGGGDVGGSFSGSLAGGTNFSLVKIGAGTQTLHGVSQLGGEATLSNGTLIVNGAITGLAAASLQGGTLGGTGVIASTSVINFGATVAPGASAGILTVLGDYAVAAGTLDIELAGTTPGGGHDRIQVTGSASLAGTLNVTTNNGFAPASGSTFTVLTASVVSGNFGTTNLPALSAPELGWSVQYLADAVVLSVTGAPTAGGYDAFVLQIANPADRGINADPDGDGYVNLLEYVTGGNPTNAGQAARMAAARTNGVLALRFMRNINSTDATLFVEGAYAASNNAAWTGVAMNSNGLWTGSTVTETGGPNPVNVTVQDTDPAATNRFLRLRVTRP